jgi:site-specific recombinase XerD
MASGLPLTDRGISELFRLLQKRTGMDGKRVSAHNCRRYMATTQLANGRSPFDVQQLQQSHDLYSPLRAKDAGSDRESSGSGYWDIE